MTKSELRLGSLYCFIQDESGDGFDKPGIDTLDVSHFWTAHEYSFDILNYIEGIPLTEDWLLTANFDKFEGYDFDTKHLKLVPIYLKDEVSIMLSGGKYWYVRREYDGGTSEPYEPVTEIDFLHQLQNLFYCLNQDEIIIKA